MNSDGRGVTEMLDKEELVGMHREFVERDFSGGRPETIDMAQDPALRGSPGRLMGRGGRFEMVGFGNSAGQ